jgi:succinate dehydrogenase / fumarate reductase cytochrome b subunit
MSARAGAGPVVPPVAQSGFFTSSIGKKVVMAVTGAILCGFILGHMSGNLQAFLPVEANGEQALDHYGVFLRQMLHGTALWLVRGGLLLAVALHVWAFVSLTRQNMAARPAGYRETQRREATFASRSMKFTGPIILVFVVYHILHMTTGTVHPQFEEGRVFHNLVTGLQVPLVALFYVFAMAALSFHVWHGFWSMLQTVGASHPRYNPLRKKLAILFTVLVCGGFAAVPLAVLAGVIK